MYADAGPKIPAKALAPAPGTVVPKKESNPSPPTASASPKRTDLVPVRTNSAVGVRSKPRTKANSESAKPTLTKEERYAYDRLMLALSITSSNLRLVADKIDIQDASADGGRRVIRGEN
jgi:hypothetical protein